MQHGNHLVPPAPTASCTIGSGTPSAKIKCVENKELISWARNLSLRVRREHAVASQTRIHAIVWPRGKRELL